MLRESVAQSASALWNRLCQPAKECRTVSEELWALRDVSLQVRPGELVGIIGRNGAGKSTLLKLLSRITEPTAGRVEIHGNVSSLLEVGTGFHPELTGRENIFLNGAILGMPRSEIISRFDDIVAFAELERLIDTPVKRYSSGMYVRLAFAVAAHLNPHVLLIDEVLAVGDLSFQRKCMEHAKSLRERGATVILVSHNMFAIKAICTRAIYFSNGEIGFDGAVSEAIHLYEKDSRLDPLPWAQGRLESKSAKRTLYISDIELLDETGTARTVFDYGERMRVRVHYEASQPVERPNFCLAFVRSDDIGCCNYNMAMDGITMPTLSGSGVVEVRVPPLKLVSELYAIHIVVWDQAFQKLYCAQMGNTFHVQHSLLSPHFGVFHEPAEWSWTVPQMADR